jgi:excinuclease ABC subunit B
MEIIRELRIGKFDVLVGINLLREGLDIPEVSLVVILDADKEGFLRSRRSLIQTFGRAARNVRGKVILYADEMTQSMKEAIEETARRRTIQIEYNRVHHITPETVEKEIGRIFESVYEADYVTVDRVREPAADYGKPEDLEAHIASLETEMKQAAAELAFERAAQLRDRIRDLKKRMVFEW